MKIEDKFFAKDFDATTMQQIIALCQMFYQRQGAKTPSEVVAGSNSASLIWENYDISVTVKSSCISIGYGGMDSQYDSIAAGVNAACDIMWLIDTESRQAYVPGGPPRLNSLRCRVMSECFCDGFSADSNTAVCEYKAALLKGDRYGCHAEDEVNAAVDALIKHCLCYARETNEHS